MSRSSFQSRIALSDIGIGICFREAYDMELTCALRQERRAMSRIDSGFVTGDSI